MKIAVIGAGITGNVVARGLHRRHDLSVFEAGNHVGGHSHTHAVEVGGRTLVVNESRPREGAGGGGGGADSTTALAAFAPFAWAAAARVGATTASGRGAGAAGAADETVEGEFKEV